MYNQPVVSSAHTASWSNKFIARKCGGAGKFESWIHLVIFQSFFAISNNTKDTTESKFALHIMWMWVSGIEYKMKHQINCTHRPARRNIKRGVNDICSLTCFLAHSFLFCSCVCFCLCGPFNCFPYILPATLHFLTLFFVSYLCSIGPLSYMSLYESLLQPW